MGSGIRTEIIRERSLAGDSNEQIGLDFHLKPREVERALQFELKLAARSSSTGRFPARSPRRSNSSGMISVGWTTSSPSILLIESGFVRSDGRPGMARGGLQHHNCAARITQNPRVLWSLVGVLRQMVRRLFHAAHSAHYPADAAPAGPGFRHHLLLMR